MSQSAVSTAAMAVIVNWTAPPVRSFIKILPGVLDAARVSADQKGDDVVAQVLATASSRPLRVASPRP